VDEKIDDITRGSPPSAGESSPLPPRTAAPERLLAGRHCKAVRRGTSCGGNNSPAHIPKHCMNKTILANSGSPGNGRACAGPLSGLEVRDPAGVAGTAEAVTVCPGPAGLAAEAARGFIPVWGWLPSRSHVAFTRPKFPPRK